jgi:hypothetical protein
MDVRMNNKYQRSIADIVSDLASQFTTLLQREGLLARTELSEKISQAALGIGLIVGGAVLLIPALVILLEAAVAALIEAGIESYWSSLIVGGAALVLGLILLLVGASRLKAGNLVPEKTIEQMKRDVDVAKQQMRKDNDVQHAA